MNFSCKQNLLPNNYWDYNCKILNRSMGNNFFNNNLKRNNNINQANSSNDEINLMNLKMKIALLNNKVNQINNAFSPINLNNQNEKFRQNIKAFNYQKNNIRDFNYTFDNNKENIGNFNNSNNYNNQENNNLMKAKIMSHKRSNSNSNYIHQNNNKYFQNYDNYFFPSLSLSQQNNLVSRNIKHPNNSKKLFHNRIDNLSLNNYSNYNNYNITNNNYSLSQNSYQTFLKNTQFGNYDSYFLESIEAKNKSKQNSNDISIGTISNENEQKSKRPKKINQRKNKKIKIINNFSNSNLTNENKNDIETDYKDKHKSPPLEENEKISNSNDINDLIIHQNQSSEKKLNTQGESNEKNTKKFSILNKLFQLGKKNENIDKIENEKRNKDINDKDNKLMTSDNYSENKRYNNNIIIFNNFDNNKNKNNLKKNEENKKEINKNINEKDFVNKKNKLNIKIKPIKKLSFHEEDNIKIKYNQKEEIKNIAIYDVSDNLKKMIPRNINVYLSKLKRFKPKSVLLNSNKKENEEIKEKKQSKYIQNNKNNPNKRANSNSVKKELKKNLKKSNSNSVKKELKKALKKSNSNSSLSIISKNKKKFDLNDKKINNEIKIKRKTPKKEICEKFKKNPQLFYGEDLCDLVMKSLCLGEEEKKEENKNKINVIRKNKDNLLDKKINMQAYYNLKKYFEENNLDD